MITKSNIDSHISKIKTRTLLSEIEIRDLCEKVNILLNQKYKTPKKKKSQFKKKVKRNIPIRKYNNLNNTSNNISR